MKRSTKSNKNSVRKTRIERPFDAFPRINQNASEVFQKRIPSANTVNEIRKAIESA